MLAEAVAESWAPSSSSWHIKSTTKAQQGSTNTMPSPGCRDSQLRRPQGRGDNHYIRRGKLWQAFSAEQRPVLLIDEIDKADIEFPNDLLLELDRMEFDVYETGERVKARQRPVVIITSNNEKELPDAFLRRCFSTTFRFPDKAEMQAIVKIHYPNLRRACSVRRWSSSSSCARWGLRKKPSTSELLDWIRLLLADDIAPEAMRTREPGKLVPALYGALLKTEQDLHLFESSLFLARRGS